MKYVVTYRAESGAWAQAVVTTAQHRVLAESGRLVEARGPFDRLPPEDLQAAILDIKRIRDANQRGATTTDQKA